MTPRQTRCEARLTVSSHVGLHARPAAMLVKVAQGFDADIEIAVSGRKVSAKSIMGLLSLGAEHGAEVLVSTQGIDASEAMAAIKALFASCFHEDPTLTATAAAGRTPYGAHAQRGRGELIIVADDEAHIRHLLSLFLGQNGYRVILARNGSEAVQLFKDNQNEIGAVVLDVVMPEMSGTDAVRVIRRMNPTVPVLTMSGSEDLPPFPEDRTTAFLRKPFEMPEMLFTLRALLNRESVGSRRSA